MRPRLLACSGAFRTLESQPWASSAARKANVPALTGQPTGVSSPSRLGFADFGLTEGRGRREVGAGKRGDEHLDRKLSAAGMHLPAQAAAIEGLRMSPCVRLATR